MPRHGTHPYLGPAIVRRFARRAGGPGGDIGGPGRASVRRRSRPVGRSRTGRERSPGSRRPGDGAHGVGHRSPARPAGWYASGHRQGSEPERAEFLTGRGPHLRGAFAPGRGRAAELGPLPAGRVRLRPSVRRWLGWSGRWLGWPDRWPGWSDRWPRWPDRWPGWSRRWLGWSSRCRALRCRLRGQGGGLGHEPDPRSRGAGSHGRCPRCRRDGRRGAFLARSIRVRRARTRASLTRAISARWAHCKFPCTMQGKSL
jgi:hypothetical protein